MLTSDITYGIINIEVIIVKSEIWKDIKGYEGLYQVSNYGRVKSLKGTGNGIRKKDDIIILSFRNSNGYNRVHLMKNGKEQNIYVHRLVAEAFIPNPNNYPIVNHKDEDKSNNNVNNLEWCTHKYNVNYGTATERMSKTRKGHEVKMETRNKISRKLKGIKRPNISGKNNIHSSKVLCVTTNEIFESITEATRKYKANNISACCRGIQKYSGKLQDGTKLEWKYIKQGEPI